MSTRCKRSINSLTVFRSMRDTAGENMCAKKGDPLLILEDWECLLMEDGKVFLA